MEAKLIMDQARFKLRSWYSNSQSLQKAAAKDQTGNANSTVNILGLHWNTATDTLALSPKKFSPGYMT